MSLGIFNQFKNRDKVQVESEEKLEFFTFPQLAICHSEPYFEEASTVFTLGDFMNNTVDVEPYILEYVLTHDHDKDNWEVRELLTIFNGRCQAYKYKLKVS